MRHESKKPKHIHKLICIWGVLVKSKLIRGLGNLFTVLNYTYLVLTDHKTCKNILFYLANPNDLLIVLSWSFNNNCRYSFLEISFNTPWNDIPT